MAHLSPSLQMILNSVISSDDIAQPSPNQKEKKTKITFLTFFLYFFFFSYGLIPQMFAYAVNFPVQKFLQTQSIVVLSFSHTPPLLFNHAKHIST